MAQAYLDRREIYLADCSEIAELQECDGEIKTQMVVLYDGGSIRQQLVHCPTHSHESLEG